VISINLTPTQILKCYYHEIPRQLLKGYELGALRSENEEREEMAI
jgi:hypothetical protein